MSDFVYALHDFIAEHEDEIPFRAGERIEILERDDEFGDGWWQGRNLAGKTGLFPQNYTTPQPPYPQSSSNLSQFANAPEDNGSSQMAATMGDVQKALDQLGAGHRLASQEMDRTSMSFASGTDTGDDSEAEGEQAQNGWGASRQVLAEKARRELEDRQRREAQAAAPPPISLAMSDDSESEPEQDEHDDEDDLKNGFGSARTSIQPPITPTLAAPLSSLAKPSPSAFAKQPLESANGLPSAGASKTSLPIPQPSGLPSHLTITNPDGSSGEASPISPPTATLSNVENRVAEAGATPRVGGAATPRVPTEVPLPISPPAVEAPTSILSSIPRPPEARAATPPKSTSVPVTPLGAPFVESYAPGSYPLPNSLYAAPLSPKQPSSDRPADPNTWSIADVLSWLTSKGFDHTIVDKFEEQDITGDVLLSLDTTLLKEELGITAFGKRVRLNNAINDLRKSLEPAVGSPGQGQDVAPVTTNSIPGGFMLSPESAPRTNEMSPAVWTGRPVAAESSPIVEDAATPLVGLGFASLNAKGHRPSQISVGTSDGTASTRGKRSTVGSADPNFIAEEDETRDEPSMHDADKSSLTTLSKQPITARSVASRSSHEPATATETEPTSAAASLKQSLTKETPPSSIPPSPSKRGSLESPTSATSLKRLGSSGGLKGKQPVETQKDGRLSFFGGSLGKNRKPAPRYSSESIVKGDSPTLATHAQAEKRSLSRYLGGSTHKKSASGQSNIRVSSGPSTANSISSPINHTASPTQSQESPNVLRKRLSSSPGPNEMRNGQAQPITESTENALEKIGQPDHQGWMRKRGERYNSWKNRYFVLKGAHLYYLRSQTESKIKGYINVSGYKVIADENANVGKYGFRIVHDTEKPHYFSSDEQLVIREWMKAIMKATIGRDYSKPVISSCNIPTIPLNVAQAMSPAPRPPSPSARAATQRALRPANPDRLSDRDAAVLMLGVKGQERPGDEKIRQRVESVFTYTSADSNDYREARVLEPASPLPVRPSRDTRQPRKGPVVKSLNAHDQQLVDWVNTNLPKSTPRAADLSQSFASGLILFRLVEKLSGKIQGVPDALFMASLDDEDSFEGLFKLFDIMIENGISTADVSMSDIHTGDNKSISQIVESIKSWNEGR